MAQSNMCSYEITYTTLSRNKAMCSSENDPHLLPDRRPSIVGTHCVIRLDHLCKAINLRRVTPRLEFTLLPDSSSKAASPSLSGPSMHDTLNRVLVHQLWIRTCIVKQRRKMNHSSQGRDVASLTNVLMTDNGLTD
jgi:hypothetical protein